MKQKIVIVSLVILLVISAVVIAFWVGKSQKDSDPTKNTVMVSEDAKKFKSEYSLASTNNPFIFKTADEIVEIIKSGTGVVYLGFPECAWCQKYVGYLDEVAKEEKLDKIYYLNIRKDRTDNSKQYQQIIKLLESKLDKDEKGNPRVFVPNIVAVNEGKIINNNNMSALNSSAKDGTPDDWWTAERVKQLKDSLRPMIKEVKACNSVCSQ